MNGEIRVTIDRDRVLEIIRLLKESDAGELSVKEGDTRIRVARFAEQEPVVEMEPAAEALPAMSVPASTAQNTPGSDVLAGNAVGNESANSAPSPEVSANPHDVIVRSRVVGLFCRSREPGGPPLVEVGSTVKEGQVIGMVDVLRKPTDITSPASGEVTEILVEDNDGIQFGDPLFVIRPVDRE